MGKTIVGAHQTITTGVVTSALGAVNYSSEGGLSFSTESFTSGVTSSLKGALTGAVGTFTGGMMSQLNLGDSLSKVTGFSSDNVKSMQKLNDTIGGLAGQAVGFAMGDDFKFNVLNLADLTGGKVNGGLLELSIGRNGVSLGLGTGGLDMSVGTIASAVNGVVAWDVNNKINATAKASKMDIATVLRYQYGIGDSTQKDQLFSVLAGTTELRGSAGVNGEQAETVTADGKRVVTLAGYKAGMSAQEQMMLAINLGHEAYRDGVVGPDNVLETQNAARGHTEMALRMQNDVSAYNKGADAFNAYVDGNYDSSADYWRLVKDANGKVVQVLDDGDYKHATVVNEKGEVEEVHDIDESSLSAQLGNIAGMSKKDMNTLMYRSGLDFDESNVSWYVREERARYIKPVENSIEISENVNQTTEKSVFGKIVEAAGSAWETVKNGAKKVGDFFANLVKPKQQPAVETIESIAVDNALENIAVDNTPKEQAKTEKPNNSVLLNQKEIGEKLGLDGNKTCHITSNMMMYMAAMPEASFEDILEAVKGQIGKSIDKDGAFINSQPNLSKAIAKAVGPAGGTFLQNPWPDGVQTLYSTLDDFYKSTDYDHALVVYQHKADANRTHFTYVNKATQQEYDPWPGGISAHWKGQQEMRHVRPMGWSK